MASPSLYRFRIDLANVDQGVYENLDFRLVLHPSESLDFLLSRMLAYSLNYTPGLAISAEGLSNPDIPPFSEEDPQGGFAQWIEIGNPSVRRVHKATKASRRVVIYTYKNPEPLLAEIRAGDIFRPERLTVYSLTEEFLAELARELDRDNTWSVLLSDGTITVGTKTGSSAGELREHGI